MGAIGCRCVENAADGNSEGQAEDPVVAINGLGAAVFRLFRGLQGLRSCVFRLFLWDLGCFGGTTSCLLLLELRNSLPRGSGDNAKKDTTLNYGPSFTFFFLRP